MKKIIAFFLALVMALSLVACGGNETTETTASTTEAPVVTTEAPVAGAAFTVVVTDLEGNETTFEYTSDAATVGEALLAEGLISGEVGEYGLYVDTVNGITADWDADQTYWAFYIDGEYAMTGVDATEITEGTTYSFVLTGSEETSTDSNVLGEGATVFTVVVTDLEGTETTFEIHTDETTVGAALLAVELIAGEVGEYGLYIDTVNGVTADWDTDQTYWAFYLDGEYAMSGVDATEITADSTYSLILTKG